MRTAGSAGKGQAFPSWLYAVYLGSLWAHQNWASKEAKWLKHILLESAQYQLGFQDASPRFLLSCPSVMCLFPPLLYSWPHCLLSAILLIRLHLPTQLGNCTMRLWWERKIKECMIITGEGCAKCQNKRYSLQLCISGIEVVLEIKHSYICHLCNAFLPHVLTSTYLQTWKGHI